MNTIFTEHTVNNTDNNAKPKTKKKCYNRTKQELYLTIYCIKDSMVKKQRKISKKINFSITSFPKMLLF